MVQDLVWPVFVQEGAGEETPIEAMPGVHRYTIDRLIPAVRHAAELGIPAVAMFPAVDASHKDERGSEALNADNLICRAIAAVKEAVPAIGLIADVALDPYTSHGQDGLLCDGPEGLMVDNDATVTLLQQQAVLLAASGADVVAPSDMMDGRVGAIRHALDASGYAQTIILSYAVKYASAFYGPFREAVGSGALLQGDKKTYQMHPGNSAEAMREALLDVDEGADMLMVKPGLPYLDIIAKLKAQLSLPVLAYHVSGEYAMLQAASEQGWLDGDAVLMESLLAFKRAGADAVFSYGAVRAAEIMMRP